MDTYPWKIFAKLKNEIWLDIEFNICLHVLCFTIKKTTKLALFLWWITLNKTIIGNQCLIIFLILSLYQFQRRWNDDQTKDYVWFSEKLLTYIMNGYFFWLFIRYYIFFKLDNSSRFFFFTKCLIFLTGRVQVSLKTLISRFWKILLFITL